MATVNSVIERAMSLQPDVIDDSIKCRWISELEGKIKRETMHEKGEFVPYNFPEDADKELTVKPPYDNIYVLYVIAMSNFFSGELGSYSASAIMFDTAYSEFRKNYLRNNMPPSSRVRIYQEGYSDTAFN